MGIHWTSHDIIVYKFINSCEFQQIQGKLMETRVYHMFQFKYSKILTVLSFMWIHGNPIIKTGKSAETRVYHTECKQLWQSLQVNIFKIILQFNNDIIPAHTQGKHMEPRVYHTRCNNFSSKMVFLKDTLKSSWSFSVAFWNNTLRLWIHTRFEKIMRTPWYVPGIW